jgi:hypothetical protein
MTMFGKSNKWTSSGSVMTIRRRSDVIRTRPTKHALAGDNHLLRLLLDGERPNQGGDFLGRLPLGELTETLLAGPDARVDDLEEQLAGARVEDEDSAVWKHDE